MRTENQQELENHIKACLTGELESFRYIFDYTKERIFQYILSRTSNREDSLDITQEIFVDIWKALPRFKYRSVGQFYGFIFLIARRRLIKYYRSRQSQVALSEQHDDLPAERDESDFNNYSDLLTSIKRLRKKHQEVLRLWSGLSYQEIGQVLGATETTVKVWHYRAIQKLKKFLKDKI